MDREVGWSESAANDLEKIAEHIAKDSEYYAVAVVRELVAAGGSLAILAERGRIVPEYQDPKIRELIGWQLSAGLPTQRAGRSFSESFTALVSFRNVSEPSARASRVGRSITGWSGRRCAPLNRSVRLPRKFDDGSAHTLYERLCGCQRAAPPSICQWLSS